MDKCVIKIFCCTKHMVLDILKSERNIMIQEIRKADYFEEKMYGRDNIDIREPIRIVLKEYFD